MPASVITGYKGLVTRGQMLDKEEKISYKASEKVKLKCSNGELPINFSVLYAPYMYALCTSQHIALKI